MSSKKRWVLRIFLALVSVALAASVVALLIVQSAWFHNQVRLRIVREIQDATGGRVEVAAFSFDWRELRAELRGLTVRGLEPPGEPPLFRCESVAVGIRIVSAFRKKVDLALLVVRAPEVNVTVDAEGRTNVPRPKVARRSAKNPVELLKPFEHGGTPRSSRSWPPGPLLCNAKLL